MIYLRRPLSSIDFIIFLDYSLDQTADRRIDYERNGMSEAPRRGSIIFNR